MSSSQPLLEVSDLEKHFEQHESFLHSLIRDADLVQAVDGVSFELDENEVKGVIGESGCGKTTLLKTLIGLHEPTGGSIRFKGKSFDEFEKADWKAFRSSVQMIFQDPFNSLDPKMTIEENMREQLRIHGIQKEAGLFEDRLVDVGLHPPSSYLRLLPKNLSGGELQRVSIARSLLVEPDILLADEPVSMLDVSTQAAVLELIGDLVDRHEMAMLYISHDLSTLAHVCEFVNVMYLGRIVESGPTKRIIDDPKHPYTRELINAIPLPDPYEQRERTRLGQSPPTPINLGEGCRFRERCPERMDVCEETPLDVTLDGDQRVACHLYYDHEATGRDEAPGVEVGD